MQPFTTSLLKESTTDNVEPRLETLFPATYRTNQQDLALVSSNERDFLATELSIKRIDNVYEHLWLAGLPIPPRSLSYQIVLQREIVICENLNMHLLWGNGRMFLKPLPKYLLSPAFWNVYMQCTQGCECGQEQSKRRMRLRKT